MTKNRFQGPEFGGTRPCSISPRQHIDIGIIGGGIGGLAAAVALRRFGIEATVYERSPTIREAGAGMMLWPNATRVLRELGLLEQVRKQGGTSTHFQVRSSSGRVLMNLPLGSFDVPAICIRRADLLSILQSELPPDSIHLAHEFHYLEQSIDTVRVHFKNGIVKEHNAVIGADGIRSQVRSELFGPSNPLDRGYTVWRGIATYNGCAIGAGTNSESWGSGKRFGILYCGENRYTWYATGNVSPDHVDASHGRKSELREAFAGWHEPIVSLIDATADSNILKHRAVDIAPLSRWGIGKITLLGDAAHPCTPNLGQGACMGLEDALLLAQCVAGENSVEKALRRYEQLRRSRTAHIQQRSLLMGQIGQWQNPLFVTARNVVTSLLPSWPFQRNLRSVYSYLSLSTNSRLRSHDLIPASVNLDKNG